MDQAKVPCVYFKVSTLTQGKWPLAYITLGSKETRNCMGLGTYCKFT